MSGFYCIAPRVWRGRSRKRDTGPSVDLYAPGTPDYRRRATQHVVEIAPGMLRIDIGDPVSRLACEAQPVIHSVPQDPVPAVTAPPEQPSPRPTVTRPVRPVPHWRSEYGLAKR